MKMYISENKSTKNARNLGNLTENFGTTRKSHKFQEKIALPFVPETNAGKASISVEDLRQS